MCLYYIKILTVFIKGLELWHDCATRSYACDIAAYIIVPTVEQVQMCIHNFTCVIGLGRRGHFSICADRPRELLYKSFRTWRTPCTCDLNVEI